MSVRLTPQQLALKLATRDAVRAGGGQEFVAGETGRAQSRISDYCSPNKECFIPADLIAKLEALGAGSPGHPQITRALARAQGGGFMSGPDALTIDLPNLTDWLAEIVGESGDVLRALSTGALAAPIAATPAERRGVIGAEVHDLIEILGAFERALCRADSDTS